MTSHHDVAGVVASEEALMDFIYETRNYADAKEKGAQLFTLLEAQAKALSEAEDDVDRADKGMDVWMKRALAAEARLAEVETERDRTERNRDMWKGQCERQATQLTDLRAEIEKMRHENADS